jgi:hypothetical protein
MLPHPWGLVKVWVERGNNMMVFKEKKVERERIGKRYGASNAKANNN